MSETQVITRMIPIHQVEPNNGQIEGLPKNPRLIRDEKYEKLKKSILEDPEMLQLREILVIKHGKKYVTIGGNMRYRVLKELGHAEIPCKIIPEGTSIEKLKAYTIKDNAGFGEWDFDMLANDWNLEDLDTWGVDIPGVDADMSPDVPEEAEEDNYQIPDEIKTDIVEGDLFEIKSQGLTHRLICGDSTKAEVVDKLMGGRLADLLVTDPPYNVDYQGGTAAKLKIENDKMTDAKFRAFLTDAFAQAARIMKAGAAFYVYHASREAVNFIESLNANGLTDKQQLIWVKSSLVLGRQDYQWRHEPILYGWKDGAAHYFVNNRSLTTVIEDELDIEKMTKAQMKDMLQEMLSDMIPSTIIREDKPLRNGEHPTMKPLKLIGRNIANSSRFFDLVVDLFGGSGSTMAAANQLKRNCYTSELDPKYCQVILDRMYKLDSECIINKIG